MPTIPAICDDCGTVFDPHAIELGEGASEISVTGGNAGPCPRCGGMGSIPDGVYSSLGGVLRIALAEHYTTAQLDRIIALLRDSAGRAGGEIADDVEKESAALAWALRTLLVPKTPADLTGYLLLIVAVLTLLRSSVSQSQTMTPLQIDQLVSTAVTQAIDQVEHQPPGGVRLQTRPERLPARPGATGRKPKKPKANRRRQDR